MTRTDQSQIDARGEWWLPERPGEVRHGTLHFDQANGGQLELHGSLDHKDGLGPSFGVAIMAANSGVYPRIHGRTDEGDITLEDCFTTHESGTFGGAPAHQVIRVNQVLVSACVDGAEQLEFDGVSFGLTFLEDWVRGERIERVCGKDKSTDRTRVTASVSALESKSVQLADGTIVELRHYVGSRGDLTSRTIYYYYRWRVTFPMMRPLTDVLDVAGDLEDLVSIGTQRRNGFIKLRLHHPEGRIEHAGHTHDKGWRFIARWSSQSDERKRDLPRHEMFFTFPEVGEMDGVKAWLESVPQQRTGLRRVMAARQREGVLLTDQLMAYAASLEQLDRSRHKNGNFRTQMERLIALANPEFSALVDKPEAWIELFKTLRNDCAHNLGKSQIESADIVFMSASAYWLYVLCLMDIVGVRGVRTRFAQLGDVSWLSPRVQQVLSNPE